MLKEKRTTKLYDKHTGLYLGEKTEYYINGVKQSDSYGDGGEIIVFAILAYFLTDKILFSMSFYILPILIVLTPLIVWNNYVSDNNLSNTIEKYLKTIMWIILPFYLISYLQISNSIFLTCGEKSLGDGFKFQALREIFSIFFPYLQWIYTQFQVSGELIKTDSTILSFLMYFSPLIVISSIYYLNFMIFIMFFTHKKELVISYMNENKIVLSVLGVCLLFIIFVLSKNELNHVKFGTFTIKDQPKISWSFLREQNAHYFDTNNVYKLYFYPEKIKKEKEAQEKKIKEEEENKKKLEKQQTKSKKSNAT